VKAVQAELQTFPQKQYTAASSGNFNSARQRVAGLPEPRKSVKEAMAAAAAPRQAPQAATGSGARTLQTQRFQMSVPSNWVAYGDKTGNSVVAGPRNGLVPDGRGQVQIGYGVLMGHYRPRRGNNLQAGARELVNALRSSDPSLRVGGFQRAQVNGRQALMAEMQGASPLGGAESNLLVAVPQGNGMMYLVFAAPQRDWAGLESAARQMLGTLQVAQ
jgi:hypothetical protein